MSRREIKTEDGDFVLLPGQKCKLCVCGQPATRYCDFPKYAHRMNDDGSTSPGIQSRCSEPLCDRCAVEQPNKKDFCRRHADQTKQMIESANQYKPES